MKRIAAIILSGLALGCAESQSEKSESTHADTPEIPMSGAEHTARQITGTWAAEKIEVVFLDGEDNFVSIPTNVYPDRWTELVFTDGTPNTWLKLISEISFYDDGTMYNRREFLWDEDQDGQADRSSYTEETLGDWFAREDSVIMDTEDFYVESLIDFLTEDELYMVWDRDDPLFMDDSCVFTMNVRRKSEPTAQ